MLSHHAILTSLILPALALAAPRHPVQERAGGAIGDVFAGAPISNITVKADNVVQCRDATISWSGATDPVSLFIALGGLYVGETPITTMSDLRGGSATWLVNQAAGQTVEFRVTDAKGAVAYVQNIKIAAGDKWCLADAKSATSSASTSSTDQAWSEATSETWAPTADSAPTSTPEVQPVAAAATTTTSRSTVRSSTSSTKSSTSLSSATTLATSFAPVSPPTTTSSANSSATIVGAGAAASASRTGGASRDIVGGTGIVAALAAGAMVLGLTL